MGFMEKENKWLRIMETYAIKIEDVVLSIGYSLDKLDLKGKIHIDLRDGNARNFIANIIYDVETNQIEDFEDPKKLLIYKGLISECKGLSEDVRSGLIKLLEKIEQE